MVTYPFGRGWARAVPYASMGLGMLIFLVFGFGPSLATAALSFTNITGVPGGSWSFIGLANYQRVIDNLTTPDSEVLDALKHTLVFCTCVTIIQNTLSLLIAAVLNARPRGHLFARALVFMPTVLGVTVTGIIWTIVFNPIDGPAERLIGVFGLSSSFFGDYTWAFPLCIAVQVWASLGFSTVIYLAGLQTIPQELLEAARIDGASRWQAFRSVTFPLLAPTVTVNVLLSVIGSLQTWQIIYVLTGGQRESTVLGMYVFNTAFGGAGSSELQQGYGACLAMFQFALVFVAALVFRFYLRRREVQL